MTEQRAKQKKLERVIYLVLAVVVVIRFVTAYQHQKEIQSTDYVPKTVPEFVWRDFSGIEHTLKEVEGKPVVLHFWASWCGPCRTELPSLLQAAKFFEKDIVFLTISGDESDIPVRKFLLSAKEAAGVRPDNMLYGFDPMKSLTYDVFQTSAFPETIIIDANHMMRRKLPGAQDWQDPGLVNYLRSLIPAAQGKAASEVPKP